MLLAWIFAQSSLPQIGSGNTPAAPRIRHALIVWSTFAGAILRASIHRYERPATSPVEHLADKGRCRATLRSGLATASDCESCEEILGAPVASVNLTNRSRSVAHIVVVI